MVGAQIRPEIHSWLEPRSGSRFGRVWRQSQQCDVLRNFEPWRTVPARSVQDQQGDGPRRHVAADFFQMFVHGRDIDLWHYDRRANAASRAGRPKQTGPGKPVIPDRARTRTARGPNSRQRALLADPCFVLPPEFDGLALGVVGYRVPRQFGEVFLKASCFASSLSGCRGRTEIRRKFSRRKSSPTLRLWNDIPNRASIRSRRSTRRQRITPSVSRPEPCATQR